MSQQDETTGHMTYSQTLKYLDSFINYEKKSTYAYKESFKLERVKEFLKFIGNPQDSLRSIHIAGTKGKGSTCAFITYILREAGYKVGLYTSPHLLDMRERIRVLNPKSEIRNSATKLQQSIGNQSEYCGRIGGPTNYFGEPNQISNPYFSSRQVKPQIPNLDFEGMIPKGELVNLVQRLKPTIEKYNKNSRYGQVSFFEIYTVLAFTYFKEKKVDFAVLETGLGGRLDATNVVEPLACAITSISYDHMQKLGNTLTEIATEKAGIIKLQNTRHKSQSAVVISAPQKEDVWGVIRKKCKEVGARLYVVGKDIRYKKVSTTTSLCRLSAETRNQKFKVWGIFGDYPDLEIRLLGRHQLVNAAVAVGIIEALRFYGINVRIDSIRKGLYNTLWPGRCEVISKEPFIILDGAQNLASAKGLKETIKENFFTEDTKFKRLILVLGISKDKDIAGICKEICFLADTIILTQASNPRAANVGVIEKIIREQDTANRTQIIKTKDIKEAKNQAIKLAGNKDLILVTGSLFVVGEFRNDKI